jgi:hypothetical protein
VELVKWLRYQWDRAAAVVAVVTGLLALLLGWIGISGLTNTAAQMPYIISGGVFGLFCLGLAGILWLSADLRDEWRLLHQIRDVLQDQAGRSSEVETAPTPARPATNEGIPVRAEARAR